MLITNCDFFSEFAFDGGPSPTENSYRSMHASVKGMVVNLPAKNGKDTPSSDTIPSDKYNNNLPQDKSRDDFPEGLDKEKRRHSFPSDTPKKEEHVKVKRCSSALLPRLQEEKRKFNPGND